MSDWEALLNDGPDGAYPTRQDLRRAALNMHDARFDYHDERPAEEDIDPCELARLEGLAEIAIYAYLDRRLPLPPPPPVPENTQF